MRGRFVVLGLIVGALAFAGCSPGDEAVESTTTTTTVPPETTTTTEPRLDVQTHAEGLMVGIAAEGDFLALDAPGSVSVGEGSGIVIAEDGLILTTATSVVGADRINVFVPGQEFPLVGELDAAAECVNLALVRVDHTFGNAVAVTGSTQPIAVASADRTEITSATTNTSASGESYIVDTKSEVVTGAVLFDEAGVFAGIVTGYSATGEPVALRSDVAESWITTMRQREVVEQLGFSAVENTEGQAVVAAVASAGPGMTLGLAIGDVVITADGVDLVEGVGQLCAAIDDGEGVLEVIHEGRRHVGSFPDEPIVLASSRTTEQIRQAVVDISAGFGGGTGFFVSADGLLVTNYHVAGDESEVMIRLDGSEEQTPARLIGTSACADLAVLQAEGGPYEYLEWAPEAPVLEEPIRAVGFPNFTESISFQDGRVTKETAEGATWGGFLTNFESSAQVDGGNSGGPVVNEYGEVLGVVYAIKRGNVSGIWESVHLFGTEAREVVDALVAGSLLDPGFTVDYPYEDYPVIGEALQVGSVSPNGPAAATGIETGDVLAEFGPLDAWSGFGGFEGICNYVTDKDVDSALNVVLYRPDTASMWDGQLNGATLQEWPDEFRQASQDRSISLVVPGPWSDYQPIEPEDGNDWVGFFAAPDIASYFNPWGTAPGLRVLWSYQRAEEHTTESFLESLSYSEWALGEPFVVESEKFVGHGQWFLNPNGNRSVEYAVTRRGLDDSPLIVLYISDEDYLVDETAESMFESLELDLPDLEG